MTVRVVTAAEPFVLPSDIAGSHAADDVGVAAMIAAVTGSIDSYRGTLGRCLGPQLLEWSMAAWPCGDDFEFPIGPLLEVEAVTYVDGDGDTQTWAFTEPLYFENMPPVRGRRADIKIQYWAGYGAREADDPFDWVPSVPEEAKQAVILLVQHMIALGGTTNLFVRSEEVEGIGTKTYTVSDQAMAVIKTASDSLLQGLKVYRV
jgi:hypothetical protein